MIDHIHHFWRKVQSFVSEKRLVFNSADECCDTPGSQPDSEQKLLDKLNSFSTTDRDALKDLVVKFLNDKELGSQVGDFTEIDILKIQIEKSLKKASLSPQELSEVKSYLNTLDAKKMLSIFMRSEVLSPGEFSDIVGSKTRVAPTSPRTPERHVVQPETLSLEERQQLAKDYIQLGEQVQKATYAMVNKARDIRGGIMANNRGPRKQFVDLKTAPYNNEDYQSLREKKESLFKQHAQMRERLISGRIITRHGSVPPLEWLRDPNYRARTDTERPLNTRQETGAEVRNRLISEGVIRPGRNVSGYTPRMAPGTRTYSESQYLRAKYNRNRTEYNLFAERNSTRARIASATGIPLDYQPVELPRYQVGPAVPSRRYNSSTGQYDVYSPGGGSRSIDSSSSAKSVYAQQIGPDQLEKQYSGLVGSNPQARAVVDNLRGIESRRGADYIDRATARSQLDAIARGNMHADYNAQIRERANSSRLGFDVSHHVPLRGSIGDASVRIDKIIDRDSKFVTNIRDPRQWSSGMYDSHSADNAASEGIYVEPSGNGGIDVHLTQPGTYSVNGELVVVGESLKVQEYKERIENERKFPLESKLVSFGSYEPRVIMVRAPDGKQFTFDPRAAKGNEANHRPEGISYKRVHTQNADHTYEIMFYKQGKYVLDGFRESDGNSAFHKEVDVKEKNKSHIREEFEKKFKDVEKL